MITMTFNSVTYKAPLTTKVMHRVALLWKKNALQMLRRQGHKATGALANSIKIKEEFKQEDDAWSIELTPDVDYWQYVDSGVDGVKKKYTRESFKYLQTNTRTFSFTNKKPPLSAIMGWLKVKGYQGRNEKGQFITDRSFGFIVQEAIFQRGLKPSYFISKTGDNILKKYSDPIASAVAQDVANIVAQIL